MEPLLKELQRRWGFSRYEMAKLLGVTNRDIRAWEYGAEPSDNQALRIKQLNDFCVQLSELGAEPGTFMSSPVIEGFVVTGRALYTAGLGGSILAYLCRKMSVEQLLAKYDLDWRRNYWTSFKAVRADDGGVSLVGKSYDDVVRQVER